MVSTFLGQKRYIGMFPGGRKLQQIVKDKETKKTGYGFCPWLVIVRKQKLLCESCQLENNGL